MNDTVRKIFRGFLLLFTLGSFWTAVYLYLMRQSGADSRVLIQGAGNSGNNIRMDTIVDDLANQLAQQTDLPEISPDEMTQIGHAVRQKAADGDPTAALVMLRLAKIQQAQKSKK